MSRQCKPYIYKRCRAGVKKWAVTWWPAGRDSPRRDKGFITEEEAKQFVVEGCKVEEGYKPDGKKGRKGGDREREQRELPEDWTDELTEVMLEVIKYRNTYQRNHVLLSDFFVVMKKMGYRRFVDISTN